MVRSPLVVVVVALGSGFLGTAAAVAQPPNPLAGADCREAKLERVIQGRSLSVESVIVCESTEQLRAAIGRSNTRVAAQPVKVVPAPDRRGDEHVAFNPPLSADRECAMLSCPTYVLTGVGD